MVEGCTRKNAAYFYVLVELWK